MGGGGSTKKQDRRDEYETLEARTEGMITRERQRLRKIKINKKKWG